jgi:DNA repair exonuclease SbcCD ATPase subunit
VALNIIVGIVLTIIFLYICVLVYSLWRLKRLVKQACQWNDFRDQLFVQTQENQERSKRITISIGNQYGVLGVPYKEDRDEAFDILNGIFENSEASLKDRENRAPISSTRDSISWRIFLIRPLWTEYQNRQSWWQTTLKLQSRLRENHSDFSEIERILNKLNAKGRQIKSDFEILQNQTDARIRSLEDLRQSDDQFQAQIQQLQQLKQKIAHTITQYFSEAEPSPKQIAAAASKLQSFLEEFVRIDTPPAYGKNPFW